MHQGAWPRTKPIQIAPAETAAKAKPAKRTPQVPSPQVFRRKNSHGPAHKLRLLPTANKAMVAAPSKGWLVNAATIKAE
jgi:hypothetical protein